MNNDDVESYLLIIASILSLEFLQGWLGVGVSISIIILAIAKIFKIIDERKKLKDERGKLKDERKKLEKENQLLDIELIKSRRELED